MLYSGILYHHSSLLLSGKRRHPEPELGVSSVRLALAREASPAWLCEPVYDLVLLMLLY